MGVQVKKFVALMKKRFKGASAVEYALIVALIAAVIGVGIAAFGTSLNSFFNSLFATLHL